MWRFLASSVLSRLLLLVVISILAHAIVHLAPGEPSEVDPTNPRLKAADVQRIRAAFHLDEPLPMQYLLWVRDLATGELRSFKDGEPVLPKIWERFLNSLPLFIGTTLLVWTLSFPIGVHAAVRRGAAFDRGTMLVSYLLISIPGFVLSYVVIVAMVNSLGVPVIGMHTFGMQEAPALNRVMDRIWHLAVPSLMAGAAGMAVLSRYVRSQMSEVIGQDYIRTARAKGLDGDTVLYRHGLRNALLPFITMFGLLLPNLIGGSVIFEQIFAWPGIGRLGYDAILSRDFPVILTLNFVAAALTLAGTLISDILYAVADPRIRLR